MTIEVKEKLYTVEEFLKLEWAEDDPDSYELIGGRIVARGSTSGKHGRLVSRLAQHINNFLDNNPGGSCYAEASCTLGLLEGKNYPKPDVCFVAQNRTPVDFDGQFPSHPIWLSKFGRPATMRDQTN